LRDGDYYGSPVNRCAQLRNAAHGGQILISETTYYLVRDELPTGVSLRDLGEYHLKGLERPEHVFQPVVPDLPAEFPPLNTPGRIRNNLPLSLTSFIGREGDIDELEGLLLRSRLLTITGPGGAGKTRLAIQVAHNVQGSFPDGVWFIDLALLSNTSLLSQHLINVLGMREVAGYTPDQTLMDVMHNKNLLLIFDNCEHLLPEVSQLAETMLRRASRVRILATSREKIGASGEVIWRIPPLSSPNSREVTGIEKLLQYESVKLFLDRATAARSNFTITRDNAGAVAQICAHLDGLPLAIELAAARVRVLSVEEILKRLNDRFRLLVGPRTALPRQQTLRALVDWSYELLSEKERILLRRLSVFSGGWTLDAAEQVCSGGEVEAGDVLDLLTSLIDKSFINGEIQNGPVHYRFLETIQQFSQERLLESNETDGFAQKHASYYLKFAESSYGKLWDQSKLFGWYS
jgi:predicted ATPase